MYDEQWEQLSLGVKRWVEICVVFKRWGTSFSVKNMLDMLGIIWRILSWTIAISFQARRDAQPQWQTGSVCAKERGKYSHTGENFTGKRDEVGNGSCIRFLCSVRRKWNVQVICASVPRRSGNDQLFSCNWMLKRLHWMHWLCFWALGVCFGKRLPPFPSIRWKTKTVRDWVFRVFPPLEHFTCFCFVFSLVPSQVSVILLCLNNNFGFEITILCRHWL